MDLAPDFRELLAELAAAKVDFLIVGGYAVAFHGRPRATKDIDVLLRGNPGNLDRAGEAITRFGAPQIAECIRKMKETEIVYMGKAPLRIDFLRSIEAVDTEALFEHAVTTDLDGVHVRIISIDDLITNKSAVARPQDLEDVRFLRKVRERR